MRILRQKRFLLGKPACQERKIVVWYLLESGTLAVQTAKFPVFPFPGQKASAQHQQSEREEY